MAVVTKSSDAGIDANTAMFAPQISSQPGYDLVAGEDLGAVVPCRIHTDGKVYASDGSAADAEAKFDGVTPVAYKAGMPVVLYGPGVRANYSTGMTPGQNLYLGVADGTLETTATPGGTVVIARAVTATDIVIMAKQ